MTSAKRLAYGLWVTKVPSLVIFDRNYRPFLIVSKSGQASECDDHHVKEIVLQVFFWGDGSPDELRQEISESVLKIMRENVYGP